MRWRLPVGLAVLATLVVIGAAVLTTSSSSSSDPGTGSSGSSNLSTRPGALSHTPPNLPLDISVGDGTVGSPIKPGFLGFSFEFSAVRAYTGSDPTQINPVLVELMRDLTPGQAPVLRIGGDSTDASWVPALGVTPPPEGTYPLTASWFATTAALVRELGARLIMGINLAGDQPALAGAEAQADVSAFGVGAIDAFEIGNEPNIYGKIDSYRTPSGVRHKVRPRSYDFNRFLTEFEAENAVLPPLALAGPALAAGPTPSRGSWIGSLGSFIDQLPRLSTVTLHRYPLRNCYVPASSPQYATIAHLLTSFATTGLADSIKRYVAIAHAHDRQIRLDELNSVACRGRSGVSDTFASALWVVDALFSLARAGVDGVNLHTLPGAAYELFQFSHLNGSWRASVRPVYYGLMMFARAAPPGSRLLRSSGPGVAGLSVWATRAPDGRVRVTLINKDPSASHTISLSPPGGVSGPAMVQRLRAPSVAARRGVTLGGRGFGAETSSGRLAPARAQSIRADHDAYALTLPGASAALITFGPPRG
jgi:hypothetical protein